MSLVDRLANALKAHKPHAQRMFSGTGFMLNGNLVVASTKRGLLVRVGSEAEAKATSLPHAKIMEMRGRKMPGWIIVTPEGFETEDQLATWVSMALAFNKTLPSKPAAAAKRAKKK